MAVISYNFCPANPSVRKMEAAVRSAFEQELLQNPEWQPDSLKAMAENKSSLILGTECLQGRPVLHLQFSEQVPGMGEMYTHHWMDKETWMPIRTEYYNAKGELVNRREVRELRLNQGLPDSV